MIHLLSLKVCIDFQAFFYFLLIKIEKYMKEIIPIFPLNIVMYPGAKYPLHIFEERYKKMVRNSILSGEGFGIVSKIDLEISNVGCYVLLDRILKQYDNGSMDIIVDGIERFQILSKTFNPDGYIEAAVIQYNDTPEEVKNQHSTEQALQKFKNIINKTTIELEKAELKSFKLAEKSGLNIKQQQNMLDIKSENSRIDFLLEHFQKIESYLIESQAIREIIAGDGYIN